MPQSAANYREVCRRNITQPWGVNVDLVHGLVEAETGNPVVATGVTVQQAWVIDAGGVYHSIDTSSIVVVNPGQAAGQFRVFLANNANLYVSFGLTPPFTYAVNFDVTYDPITVAEGMMMHQISAISQAAGGTLGSPPPGSIGLPPWASVAPASASELYVSSTALPGGDGLTWGTAFQTINEALAIIPKCQTASVRINVDAGTYNEALFLEGVFQTDRARWFLCGSAPTPVPSATEWVGVADNTMIATGWLPAPTPVGVPGVPPWTGTRRSGHYRINFGGAGGTPLANNVLAPPTPKDNIPGNDLRGRTVHFTDGTSVGYATLTDYDDVAGNWIEVSIDPSMVIAPNSNWAASQGTVFTIISAVPADNLTQTVITTPLATDVHTFANISSSRQAMSTSMNLFQLGSGANLISHIRFMGVKPLLFDNADRIALCGVASDGDITFQSCNDGCGFANAVPQTAGQNLLFPDIVFTGTARPSQCGLGMTNLYSTDCVGGLSWSCEDVHIYNSYVEASGFFLRGAMQLLFSDVAASLWASSWYNPAGPESVVVGINSSFAAWGFVAGGQIRGGDSGNCMTLMGLTHPQYVPAPLGQQYVYGNTWDNVNPNGGTQDGFIRAQQGTLVLIREPLADSLWGANYPYGPGPVWNNNLAVITAEDSTVVLHGGHDLWIMGNDCWWDFNNCTVDVDGDRFFGAKYPDLKAAPDRFDRYTLNCRLRGRGLWAKLVADVSLGGIQGGLDYIEHSEFCLGAIPPNSALAVGTNCIRAGTNLVGIPLSQRAQFAAASNVEIEDVQINNSFGASQGFCIETESTYRTRADLANYIIGIAGNWLGWSAWGVPTIFASQNPVAPLIQNNITIPVPAGTEDLCVYNAR